MRRLDTEARVLDVVNLHDTDRIVSFFSADWGQKRGVAKGARRKFSRFGGQLQLLSRVAVRWFEKDHVELVRIESVELIEPPGKLLDDLEGILAASYMAEHLREFAQENEDSRLLSRLVESTLQALDVGVPLVLALRFYEVWMLRLAGIFPVPEECVDCGREMRAAAATLSSQGEGITCAECVPAGAGVLRVEPAAVDFLIETAHSGLRELPLPEAGVLRQVEEIAARIRRAFLDHELRSYEVMKSTLEPRLVRSR